jgi:lipopolysaccharide/colanic/teichoic acid biosynthesis glycosyltransferase
MLRVKLQFVVVLTVIGLLFALDKLFPTFIVPVFIYPFVLIMGLVLLLVTDIVRIPAWILGGVALVAYLVGFFLFVPNRTELPFVDQSFLLGLVFTLVSFGLLYWVAYSIRQALLIERRRNVDPDVLPRLEGEARISNELYRARRFERPTSVVYAGLPVTLNGRIKQDAQAKARQELLRAIQAITYRSDIVTEAVDGFIIGLPESDRRAARIFTNQLGKVMYETYKVSIIIGAASFPEDGLVTDELIKVARDGAKLWVESDFDGSLGERKGDLAVELDERMRIETQAEWVNRVPEPTVETRRVYQMIKRSIDVGIVLAVMPFALPIMMIVAALIYLDDRQSIFYTQPRTGYGGKRFQMYKFRTMRVGAKSVPPTTIVAADGTLRYMWPEKVENDPRITRVGRILRKTSLDEVPQILNILRGDMTLVGPRPTSWSVDMYTPHQTARLTVRPGITGLWQVSARDATNMDERLIWDMKYIQKANLWMDIKIVWLTVMGVFQKSGV